MSSILTHEQACALRAEDPDLTLSTAQLTAAGRRAPLLALTVLWHPQRERVGAQHIVVEPHATLELGRFAPLFRQPGGAGEALGDRAIARLPLRIAADPRGLLLTPPDSKMLVELNGRPLHAAAVVSHAELEGGAVLGLGGQVLLCLHWMHCLPKDNAMPALVGVGAAAVTTRDLIRQVGATELPVLLLGETGTGKEVAARAIHQASRRRAQPLVAVNMATLNEALAAADLFGAVKGAYTGAQAARRGWFAEADGATLFLDEIGDTPGAVQAMLLRVLETGSYRPLGAAADVRSDARLIAATDRDLQQRGFNQALLRRMEGFVIHLPALRQRREDIGVLLQHLLRQEGYDGALPFALVSGLCNHDWPGNIRQLGQVTRRVVLALRAGSQPVLADFLEAAPAALAAAGELGGAAANASANTSANTAANTSANAAANGSANASANAAANAAAGVAARAGAARRRLADVGAADVLQAMHDNGWQIRAAALQLGISRPSLYKLLQAHPGVRVAARIAPEELQGALRQHGGHIGRCAAALQTPSEALRRHLRVLGLVAPPQAPGSSL